MDAESGILFGVKLLGEQSRNGRRYTPESMRKAVGLYEGLKSYVDHPEREKLSEDRKFKDWSGIFRNAHYREGQGIFADQHLRKSSEYFAGIVEAAQKFPNSVGYSHVADGDSRIDGTTEIIESITEVFSVDLVTDPATTAGFFESHKKPTNVKQAIESLPEGTTRKRLLEMIDGGYLDGAQQVDTDPQSQMLDAIVKTLDKLMSTVSDLAGKIAMSNQTDTPDPEPITPEPGMEDAPASPATPEPTPAPDVAAMKQENAELKAKNLLLESGVVATTARVKALAKVADEAEQRELLESWPVEAAGERPARSPALVEASLVDAADFETAEKFAARYR